MKIRLGTPIVVRTTTTFNGTNTHPGVVNRVWTGASTDTRDGPVMVNCAMFPDCAGTQNETSILVHDSEQEAMASASPGRCAWIDRGDA
jgi:hypothetical protein